MYIAGLFYVSDSLYLKSHFFAWPHDIGFPSFQTQERDRASKVQYVMTG